MKLQALLTRARYLALALPVFALVSTVHAGCVSGPTGLYYGGRGKTSSAAQPDDAGSCVVYHTGYSGYGGYYGPCDDEDGYGSGGYGSYGGYGGYGP